MSRLPVLLASLFLAACAVDAERVERLEQQQTEQNELIAEQNELVADQAGLLTRLTESQQQMVEMLSDIGETLQEIRVRADVLIPEDQDDGQAGENGRPRRVLVNDDGKVIIGRNEWVWVELLQRHLKARIDTGALSSSLNAVELQPFERDGDRWIRFRVPDEDHPDGGEVYAAPLVRYVRIRQASAEELERRPVIRLDVRVGELTGQPEFTLTNRENMLYPILLGRNFLRDVAVVDVARKFVHEKFEPEADGIEAEAE